MSSFALDIETRKNVRILMTASFHGATTSTYELRSGTSIVAGQGSSTAGAPIFNCNSQSSSNPNSGDRDNCRWSGNVLADKLVLQAPIGEFGLSGGADGGVSQPSVLKLTQFDGLLDCQSKPNNGDFDLTEGGNGTPQVGVVRKDNLNPNEPCQLIPVEPQRHERRRRAASAVLQGPHRADLGRLHDGRDLDARGGAEPAAADASSSSSTASR